MKISKYKSISAKDCVPNWYEEVFVVKKIKNTLQWRCVISDFNAEKIVEAFNEKELQRANQAEFRIDKEVKEK